MLHEWGSILAAPLHSSSLKEGESEGVGWRQNGSTETLKSKANSLRTLGVPFLSHKVVQPFPQRHARHVLTQPLQRAQMSMHKPF